MDSSQNEVNLAYEACELTCFSEVDLVSEIIQKVISKPADTDFLYGSFCAKVTRYQEQPELLDPHLECMLSPLTTHLKLQAQLDDVEQGLRSARHIARFLQCITSVRGHKYVVKYYPVEVEAFDPVLQLLKRFRAVNTQEEGIWEVQCQLMLWLSALSQIPFDLSLLDPSGAQGVSGVVQEILTICEDVMGRAGTVRDLGCILLYKLLSRADQEEAAQKYLKESNQILGNINAQEKAGIFRLIGVTQSVGWLFKHCRREMLTPVAAECWSAAVELLKSKFAEGNILLRRLAVKLCQRIGLTWLTPKTLSWRYVKRTVQLGEKLVPKSEIEPSSVLPAENDGDEEEGWDIPEELEEVFEVLLLSIKDKDTSVRWSAAKGIGRICGRLPKALVEDVLASLVDTFSPLELESGWHGACLTVAELARRGLLLPESIPTVVPLIESALVYDVSKGSYSVGANVRDAAAYVCWAYARSYEAHILAQYMGSLAQVLMVVACTDREVNCRRAASAAFQECVGRIGNVPNGIDILNTANYFAVSTLSLAYLDVTPSVAIYPHYRQHLADHLLHVKLRHWDIAVRDLAGSALRKLVPLDPDFYSTDALALMLKWCLNETLDIRHGAGLGLASVLLGLSENDIALGEDMQKRVGNIVMDVEKARLYRGKSGGLMRSAVCRMIASIAKCGFSGPPRRRERLLTSVNEILRNPNEQIQSDAVLALHCLARECTSSEIDSWLGVTTDLYTSGLASENVAIRRGYAQALGALPQALIALRAEGVLGSLCQATCAEEDPEDRDAESRVAAVRAFSSLLVELICGKGASPTLDSLMLVRDKHLEVVFNAMDDYNTDHRGDVGSWVRCAAMESLQVLISTLAKESCKLNATEFISSPLMVRVVGCMLRNAVERISRVRETAAQNLKLLLDIPEINLPLKKQISQIFASEDGITQFSTSDGIPQMTIFLDTEQYQHPVLEGLVASLGGLDKSLSDIVKSALVQHVQKLISAQNESKVNLFIDLILDIWQKHCRSPRMATPVLKTLYQLLRHASLVAHLSADHANKILGMVRSEIQKCPDIQRLLAAASVTCLLAVVVSATSVEEAHKSQAWRIIAVLLANRYPRVRKGVAEILYEEMLFHPGNGVLEGIMGLLLDTVWDGPVKDAVDARNQLCEKVGLEPIIRKSTANKHISQQPDENSYKSFISDFERRM